MSSQLLDMEDITDSVSRLTEANLNDDLFNEYDLLDEIENCSETTCEAEENVVQDVLKLFGGALVMNIRNPCLSHQMHNTVKEATSKSKTVKESIDKINNVAVFFRKRPNSYEMLKSKTGGIGIILPGGPRWNSKYDSLCRLVKPRKDKVTFYDTNRGWLLLFH